jgi:arylsulfatase
MFRDRSTRAAVTPLILAALLPFAVPASAGAAGADTDAARPNVVLMMADDLGFADLGCYGATVIETPTLDRLAAEGLRFSQFYNTAKCHSSRVCLMTGLYCFQAGSSSIDRGVTIAEVLRPAGYFTAMVGKWHLREEPTDRGFQRYFGHLSGATDFFHGDKTFRLNGEPFTDFGDDFYTTDANTDYAIGFIDEALDAKRPFFLYFAHNAPHYPLQAPKDLVEKYRGRFRLGWDEVRRRRYAKQVEMGLIDPKWKLSPRPDYIPAWDKLSEQQKAWEDFRMAVFAAMIDRIDENLARLIEHLEARGVYENTLILFCSDNGGCPFERTHHVDRPPWQGGSHLTYDVGWAHASNTPFRWYKQNQHEGGIASPLVVHWPAGLKAEPGSITHQPAHLIDVMPTLAELAGAKYPAEHQGRSIEPVSGRSLVPIFAGRTRKPHDWLYFQFSTDRAIRRGDWKLATVKGARWELYNLAEDRTELDDLAAEQPDRVEELAELWHRVAENVDRAPAKLRRPVEDHPARPYFKRAKGNMPPIPPIP